MIIFIFSSFGCSLKIDGSFDGERLTGTCGTGTWGIGTWGTGT